jgi:two-component system chemotaxis response regulator CheY
MTAAASAMRHERSAMDETQPNGSAAMSDGDAYIGHLKLPAVLNLAAAEGLLGTLQSRLLVGARLRVDASAVETLTLPCVQIILAALQSYDRISIERPSAAFVVAFEDLGLDLTELCKPRPGERGEQSADEDAVGDVDHPPAQTEERKMSKRILTIDDSRTIRDMLMLTLAEAGFEVLQAVDGQDGLDVLGKQTVDVVITDINMPRMDGYEVIRQLRSNPTHKTTPILVLTTESEPDKKNLAREAGATGWMVKPFDPDRLIATINKVAP